MHPDYWDEEARRPRSPIRDGIDYSKLPPDALLDIRQVVLVTYMSRVTIEKKVAAQEMPAPRLHKGERMWEWGELRQWVTMHYERDDFA